MGSHEVVMRTPHCSYQWRQLEELDRGTQPSQPGRYQPRRLNAESERPTQHNEAKLETWTSNPWPEQDGALPSPVLNQRRPAKTEPLNSKEALQSHNTISKTPKFQLKITINPRKRK